MLMPQTNEPEVEVEVEEEPLTETPEIEQEPNTDMDFLDAPVDEDTTEEVLPTETVTPTEEPTTPTEEPAVQPTEQTPPAVSTEVQALQTQVAELSAYIQAQKDAQAAEVAAKPKELTIEDQEFVKTDEDLRNALESPANFNALLNNIFKAGAAKGRELALQEMPEVAQTETNAIINRRALVTNFYAANPELAPYANDIKAKAMELAQAGNYKTYPELLEAAEAAIRREKNIVKAVPQVAPVAPAKSAAAKPLPFAGGTGGAARRPSPAQVSAAQKDVADLLGL